MNPNLWEIFLIILFLHGVFFFGRIEFELFGNINNINYKLEYL